MGSRSVRGPAALAVVVLMGTAAWVLVRRVRRTVADAVSAATPTMERGPLRYHLPVGQDPAPVMGALHLRGYETHEGSTGGVQDLLITAPGGRRFDREDVRDAIAQADLTLEGDPTASHPIRFADEPDAGPQRVPEPGPPE